jgi:heme exporter protein C
MIVDFRRWSVAAWLATAAANALALTIVWLIPVAVVERAGMPSLDWPAQKIFYFHVPSAIVSYVFFALAFIFSILYLWKGVSLWDVIAHSCAEVGWVFITVVIISGPIWGRSYWGLWWANDARLTTALILWLMYTAYFLLRLFSGHDARTPRIAAVLAIVAAFNIPIVHWAIKFWGEKYHPATITAVPTFRAAFLVCLLAVMLLGAAFALTRVRVGLAELERTREQEHA